MNGQVKRNLEVDLFRVRNVLVGFVMNQTHRGPGFAEDHDVRFTASNGYSIQSITHPAIGESHKALYVRGDEESKDHNPFMHVFANDKDAANFAEAIRKAVNEYNMNNGLNPPPDTGISLAPFERY